MIINAETIKHLLKFYLPAKCCYFTPNFFQTTALIEALLFLFMNANVQRIIAFSLALMKYVLIVFEKVIRISFCLKHPGQNEIFLTTISKKFITENI